MRTLYKGEKGVCPACLRGEHAACTGIGWEEKKKMSVECQCEHRDWNAESAEGMHG